MHVRELLLDLFGRIDGHVTQIVEGLDAEALQWSPAPGANPIGWLVWHLTRVQDSHVAEAMGVEQRWATEDWPRRFGLLPDPDNTGYGHDAEQVAAVRPEGWEVLVEYHTAVAARTRRYLRSLHEEDLDRVVDERWEPPVTLGVRLVSVADDDSQHAGQAKYVRGLLDAR